MYKTSTIRETVTTLGGKSLFLPDLADRVTDNLYGKRTTLAEAAQQFKLGDRAELQRWRGLVAACFHGRHLGRFWDCTRHLRGN